MSHWLLFVFLAPNRISSFPPSKPYNYVDLSRTSFLQQFVSHSPHNLRLIRRRLPEACFYSCKLPLMYLARLVHVRFLSIRTLKSFNKGFKVWLVSNRRPNLSKVTTSLDLCCFVTYILSRIPMFCCEVGLLSPAICYCNNHFGLETRSCL